MRTKNVFPLPSISLFFKLWKIINPFDTSQPAFTCSKLTIGTLDQDVRDMLKFMNMIETCIHFTAFPSLSIVNFKLSIVNFASFKFIKCDHLCYLLPFAKSKIREKHPCSSVTFSKAVGSSLHVY